MKQKVITPHGTVYYGALAEPEVEGTTDGLINGWLYIDNESAAGPRDVLKEGYPGNGEHDVFKFCDCFYFEAPWRAGIEEFYNRIGEADTDASLLWQGIYDNMADWIGKETRPIYVSCGMPEFKRLMSNGIQDSFTGSVPMILNGFKTWVHIFNGNIEDNIYPYDLTGYEFVEWMADHYNHVGDMFCGNGHVGLTFFKMGKEFTMTDINPKCIEYINKVIQNELQKTISEKSE